MNFKEKIESLLKFILSRLGVDWVIERGVIDEWEFEKWNGGKLLIYKKVSYSLSNFSTWGACYYKYYGSLIFPTGMFRKAPQICNITVNDNASACWCVNSIPTKDNVGQVYLVTLDNQTRTGEISILAIGKWK